MLRSAASRQSRAPPNLILPDSLMPKTSRWHPVMLPDDYLRKLKQDLSEVEAETRYESIPDDDPPPDGEEGRRS